jgi:hypothetical protein
MNPEAFQNRLQKIYNGSFSVEEDVNECSRKIPTPKQVKDIIDAVFEQNQSVKSPEDMRHDDI